MKVLVTGASGFLGRHLLDRLQEAGHDVVGLARRPRSDDRIVAGDILQPETLTTAIEGCDAVIHAAGGVSHRLEDSDWLHEVHVTGTENVLAAAKAAGIERVVHVSTSGTIAVSTKDRVHDESAPEPLGIIKAWPYYRAKLFAEQAALDAGAVVINPTLLLGPGDVDESSTRSVRLLLEGDIPAMPPGGLSFVDVRDVADGIVLALSKGEAGTRYLLGTVNMTIAEYYERMSRIADLPAPRWKLPGATGKMVSWLPGGWKTKLADRFGVDAAELEMASHFWYLDATRAKTELGWSPRDPGETLAETIEDVRARIA